MIIYVLFQEELVFFKCYLNCFYSVFFVRLLIFMLVKCRSLINIIKKKEKKIKIVIILWEKEIK